MVRTQLGRFRGGEINATGDGFFATFEGPARAVRCAQAIVEGAHSLDVDVRAGVHVGECEARGDDLTGIAVHIGARLCAIAQPAEVCATSTVRDLVAGSGIEFTDRGLHTLKGIPGDWAILAAVTGPPRSDHSTPSRRVRRADQIAPQWSRDDLVGHT
jgi:class 3 adenylate cyclase